MSLIIIGAVLLVFACYCYRSVVFTLGFCAFALLLYPPVFYAIAALGLAAIITGRTGGE